MDIIKGIFLGVLISGIITTCALEAFPDTVESIDFKYGYNTELFIDHINDNLELTDTKCMYVTDKIYTALKGRQCADLYKMGIHGERGLKHSLLKYNNKWGDPHFIFTYKVDGILRVLNIPASDTILDRMFPSWRFYRIYSPDRKRWTTIYRKI